jgi:hypothetical protein
MKIAFNSPEMQTACRKWLDANARDNDEDLRQTELAIRNFKPMKWINQLPKVNTWVLTYSPDPMFFHVAELQDDGEWWDGDNWLDQDAFTHWQSLPEPPK